MILNEDVELTGCVPNQRISLKKIFYRLGPVGQGDVLSDKMTGRMELHFANESFHFLAHGSKQKLNSEI